MAKGKYQRWLEPEGLALLEDWARNGLTDEQIARNIGCAAGTLYEWKKLYPEISEALKKGKDIVDSQVENAGPWAMSTPRSASRSARRTAARWCRRSNMCRRIPPLRSFG